MLGIKITGNSIILRPLDKTDLESRIRWFNDPDVRKTLIVSERFELDKTIGWFEQIQQDDSRLELIIETRQNTAVGIVGLSGISPVHRAAEIYLVIGQKEFWGKGVMLEAECLLIDWAFSSLGLEKIWAEARTENVASVVTMRKMGFQIEGTLRCDKIVDGRRIDVLRLGLLKNDFKNPIAK